MRSYGVVSILLAFHGASANPNRMNNNCPEMTNPGGEQFHGQNQQQGTALTATSGGQTLQDGGQYTPGSTINLANSGGGQCSLYASAGTLTGGTLCGGKGTDSAPGTLTAPNSGPLTLTGVRAPGTGAGTYQTIQLTAAAADGGGNGGGIDDGGGGGGIGGDTGGDTGGNDPGGTVGGTDNNLEADDTGSSSAAIAVVVVIVLAGGGFYYYRKQQAAKGGGGGDMPAAPPPPPMAAPPPPDALPAGWMAMQDPGSGREYFYNQNTGESSWVRPQFV